MTHRGMLSIVFAMASAIGCAVEPETTAGRDQAGAVAHELTAAPQGEAGTWVVESHENCSDICGGPCNCFQDLCPAAPIGKACGPVGNTCNHIVTSTVYHLVCGWPPQQHLEVAVSGSGSVTGTGISCPIDCFENVPLNRDRPITATPAPECRFDRWTGATCIPNFPETVFSPTITLHMSVDRRCTATFVPL